MILTNLSHKILVWKKLEYGLHSYALDHEKKMAMRGIDNLSERNQRNQIEYKIILKVVSRYHSQSPLKLHSIMGVILSNESWKSVYHEN